jgi:hypothetical protein
VTKLLRRAREVNPEFPIFFAPRESRGDGTEVAVREANAIRLSAS